MAWVKIDDQFPMHPKVVQSGPLGMAMQVAALCYCNRFLTDGFIPAGVVPTLINLAGQSEIWEQVVGRLVHLGMWEEADGGYRIHDYLKYQPSREDAIRERQQKSEAGRKGAQARWQDSRSEAEDGTSHGTCHSTCHGTAIAESVAKSCPVPVPVPNKEDGRTEDAHAPAREAEESGDVSGAYPTEELVLAPDVTPTERELLAVLKAIPGYPFDYALALRKIREWAVDFPSLDLVREAKKWSDWLSNPKNKVKNHNLAFRNWLEREMRTKASGTGPPQRPQARAEPKAWATLRRMMAEEMRKEAVPDDPG